MSCLLKHQPLYPAWQKPQFFFNIFRLQFLKPCVYVPSLIYLKRICTNRYFSLWNTMGPDPMVKKFFSHYAPRPLQQPQMPDMKQVKSSVCNHIRHFSLLSHLPSAGNPSTQLPHCITQHHNHHHSTNHATQSKLTLPRRQHIEKLRVEELGVGGVMSLRR